MNTLTFEEAIEQTQNLLETVDRLDPTDIEQKITDLVATENGARGFFVTYLTSDHPFANSPTQEVIEALKKSPEIVSELLVKNLVMSTAMRTLHRRNGDVEMSLGSNRVQERTSTLIKQLQSPILLKKLQQLQETIRANQGEYQSFLQRWGYDSELLLSSVYPLLVQARLSDS